MAFKDLREFLSCLEREGELLRIKKEVSVDCEISAVIRNAKEPAILFENVKGYKIPVVGNVFGNMKKVELALGVSRERLLQEYLDRIKNPILPVIVKNAPVKSNILKGKKVNLTKLPIPKVNEKDGGRYIDAGIVVGKDPEFGRNLSLHRMQLKGKKKSGIYLDKVQHLTSYQKRAEDKNKPVEIAVIIGCDPTLYIASQVTGDPYLDEYTIAGALRKKPVELVKCETVNIEVPAYAEIVLEGRILPHKKEPEGPFGEFSGYYTGGVRNNNVVEFSCITYRDNPIYQMIYQAKPPTENVYFTSIPKAADLYKMVKTVVTEVNDVYLTPGGCGRFHAVVSIKKRLDGEPKLALSAILSSRMGVKHAVIVDDDIDIRDPSDVEWAIATRSQFDRDSVIIKDAPGMLDPSSYPKRGDSLITKVGIDATKPLNTTFPELCDVPEKLLEKVRKNWKEYIS